MIGLEIDFPKYVTARLSAYAQRSKDGAAYSYSGEAKTRRTIESSKPVVIAMEGTSRLWLGKAKDELYQKCTKANDQSHPKIYSASQKACEALNLSPAPEILIGEDLSFKSRTLGNQDEAIIVLNKTFLETLNEDELVALLAKELAHVQNNHALFSTCSHYLQNNAVFFIRWIVQPALLALKTWSRKAEITSDRAALIATKDLRHFVAMELKLAGDNESNPDDVIKAAENIEGAGIKELFKSHPSLPLRIAALRIFSESKYYLGIKGENKDNAPNAMETDQKVTELLSSF